MKTIYMLKPLTHTARQWVAEHVDYEGYQVIGDSIAIEHRYIVDIVNALKEWGFEEGRDFEVF